MHLRPHYEESNELARRLWRVVGKVNLGARHVGGEEVQDDVNAVDESHS